MQEAKERLIKMLRLDLLRVTPYHTVRRMMPCQLFMRQIPPRAGG